MISPLINSPPGLFQQIFVVVSKSRSLSTAGSATKISINSFPLRKYDFGMKLVDSSSNATKESVPFRHCFLYSIKKIDICPQIPSVSGNLSCMLTSHHVCPADYPARQVVTKTPLLSLRVPVHCQIVWTLWLRLSEILMSHLEWKMERNVFIFDLSSQTNVLLYNPISSKSSLRLVP